MGERDRFPAPPEGGDELGALTGATGSLTPDDPDDAFVPAETREMSEPGAARDITAAAHRRADARRAEAPDAPGRLRGLEDRTAPNDRDGGYGSEHGLAAADPAYREEEHVAPPPPRESGPSETRLGGDEAHDPEGEHF